jgi:AcrR family transcriptional regulator
MDKIVSAPTRARLSSEERKASIVNAAKQLFAEKGFRGTTTREIAASLGVTEPVLYEHFRTKSELYSAIIDHCSQEGFRQLEQIAAKYAEADDDYGFFTELGNLIVRWFVEDQPFVRLLLFSHLEKHEMRELFFDRKHIEFQDMVTGYIRRRIEKGALASMDPELAFHAFTGMVGHYCLHASIFECNKMSMPYEAVVQGMVGIFLNGACVRQENS